MFWTILRSVADRLAIFLSWVLAACLEVCFMTAWVWIQWWFKEIVVARLQLEGLDLMILLTFQSVFAIASLFPVATYIWYDTLTFAAQLKRHYQRERDGGHP